MITPDLVSACLVTRGDVDLQPIIDSLPFTDIVVWNNAERGQDLQCYGRYAAIAEAKHEIIYQQDDDLIVPAAALLTHYHPDDDRGTIVANVKPGEEWPLTAAGCVFHRDLANFDAYTAAHGEDADFYRVCDVVFAYLNPFRRVWVGYTDLPWAWDKHRMYWQHDHYVVRDRARERTLALAEEALHASGQ